MMSVRTALLLLLAPLLSAALITGARAGAGETPWVGVQGAEVRLLSGRVVDGTLEAGIEIRLAPGWKTYWRYPGDSGVPPDFDWSGSRNLGIIAVAYPAPRRFSDGASGYSIGYKGAVVFPVTARIAAPGTPSRLDLTLDFAVCEALCVPAQAKLALDIPADGGSAVPALEAARAALPVPAPLGTAATPGIVAIDLDDTAAPPLVTVLARAKAPASADLFAEGPDGSWALPLPARKPGEDGLVRFTFALDGMPAGTDWSRAPLRLTLTDAGKAIETIAPLPAK
ncbi:protein-disulfide reductase DsbD domain-containing protein [Aquabacter spiritensis]|uniref:DsbC/DsbD-like thiol-disulfide interchange protein n=1 Tax=Aquabacter spiritensis TaxID=933073 RepID=A0A4R3LY26_9HYPH|nr:protein-disulfide reductase DsbD domain-containing protein [Aquabacter spiritensis]TCT05136.1 DsbC/DsbD-like thiol-disulfide interchange protein [Aquabacter spiritensis]